MESLEDSGRVNIDKSEKSVSPQGSRATPGSGVPDRQPFWLST